jgi:hypothetical protein
MAVVAGTAAAGAEAGEAAGVIIGDAVTAAPVLTAGAAAQPEINVINKTVITRIFLFIAASVYLTILPLSARIAFIMSLLYRHFKLNEFSQSSLRGLYEGYLQPSPL